MTTQAKPDEVSVHSNRYNSRFLLPVGVALLGTIAYFGGKEALEIANMGGLEAVLHPIQFVQAFAASNSNIIEKLYFGGGSLVAAGLSATGASYLWSTLRTSKEINNYFDKTAQQKGNVSDTTFFNALKLYGNAKNVSWGGIIEMDAPKDDNKAHNYIIIDNQKFEFHGSLKSTKDAKRFVKEYSLGYLKPVEVLKG